eukprot:Phypoly_transcript_16500.p2 GENE.Phypoly_transcript_16500~~Phypoly_transcript_16500.p2  ORF type:complete len:140 (+),score=20.90 Phypoly_transcript_16500:36-422(+)
MDAADCARKTHNQGEEATREKVGYFAACAVATCKIMVSLAEIKQQITVGYKGTAPGVQPPTNLPLNNLHVEDFKSALAEVIKRSAQIKTSGYDSGVRTKKGEFFDLTRTNRWDTDETVRISSSEYLAS